jgi:decaprenylphospho-beta-D-erythro-pentofuranosid-2-ulose 2-reductase
VKVLVVGSTSAIAEAAARIWAARGASFYLAARRESLQEASAADLGVRGAAKVVTERFDALDAGARAGLVERAEAALGGLDCLFVAYGTLPEQEACVQDAALAIREIELNGVATVDLVLRAAARFEAQGAGTIAVITSVAGVRGRASNFVYGAAKSLVSTLLEGLRHRLHGKGVAVVDIRPGFVDTPMTAAFPKGALWATPAKVAADIVAAVDRRAGIVYTPWFWRWIMLVIRHIPEPIFVRTKL